MIVHEEFEQLIQSEIDGRLDEAGRLRLRQLADSDPLLRGRLRQERRLTGLLARYGPNFAPAGLARAVFAKLDAVMSPFLSRRMNIGKALRASTGAGRPRRFWEFPSLQWAFGVGICLLISMQVVLFVRQLQGDQSNLNLDSFAPSGFHSVSERELAQATTPAAISKRTIALAPSKPLTDSNAAAMSETGIDQVVAGDEENDASAREGDPNNADDRQTLFARSFSDAASAPASQGAPESSQNQRRQARPAAPVPAAERQGESIAPADIQAKASTLETFGKSSNPQISLKVTLGQTVPSATAARPHTRRDVEIAIAMAGGRILSTAPSAKGGQWEVRCLLTREQTSAFLVTLEQKGFVRSDGNKKQDPASSAYVIASGQKLIASSTSKSTKKTNSAQSPLQVQILVE